jgi:hypothetical protein
MFEELLVLRLEKVGGFDYWLSPTETLWEHLLSAYWGRRINGGLNG